MDNFNRGKTRHIAYGKLTKNWTGPKQSWKLELSRSIFQSYLKSIPNPSPDPDSRQDSVSIRIYRKSDLFIS